MRYPTLGAAAAIMMATAGTASAAFVLELDASSIPGTEIVVADNGANDANPTPQLIQYSGAVGTFDITVTIGLSNAPGTNALPASLQVTSLLIDNNANTTGTLSLRLGDTGFTTPSGAVSLQSSVGGTFFGPAGSSVTFNSYADASDAQFGTATATPTQSFTFVATPQDSFQSTVSTGFAGSSSYSLTNTTVITLAPLGQVNISGTTSVVPEPAVLSLAVAGAAVMLRRRSV